MHYRSMKRRIVHRAAWIVAASLIIAVSLASDARAMCCLCRDCCVARAFCVDGLATSIQCSNFCFSNGCTVDGVRQRRHVRRRLRRRPGRADRDAEQHADRDGDGDRHRDGDRDRDAERHDDGDLEQHADPDGDADADAHGDAERVTDEHVATPTATPTATPSTSPSVTPTTPPQLSGHIGYYTGGGPVPGRRRATDRRDTPARAMTDSAGNYGFSNPRAGNVALRPSKQGDFDTAITSLDAVLVLQAVAGITRAHARAAVGGGRHRQRHLQLARCDAHPPVPGRHHRPSSKRRRTAGRTGSSSRCPRRRRVRS